MFDVDLNDLVFVDGAGAPATPAANDRITVQTLSGLRTVYYRNAANTKWGRNVPTRVGKRTKNVWTEDGRVSAGTGFWYSRAAEGVLRIKFEEAK